MRDMSEDRRDFEERVVREIDEPAEIPVRLILFLLGIALLVVFISQNSEEARIELLWFDLSLPLSITIIGSAFLGALIAILGGMIGRRRRRREVVISQDEDGEPE
jgi:uncharacterized integral membrane protein